MSIMFLRPKASRLRTVVCLGLLFGGLSGCARFHALALPSTTDTRLPGAIEREIYPPGGPKLSAERFDLDDGMNADEAVVVAVINNPDLKSTRLTAGVAAAQLLQAGLLPNPQLSADFTHPTSGPPPLFNGYSLGLNQDLLAIIARGAARASAAAHVRDIDLSILWQEWQTAERARQLYVQSRAEQQMLDLLGERQQFDQQRYDRQQTALAAGNTTRTAVAPVLVQLADTNSRLQTAAQQHNQTRHDFNLLLGLKPSVQLRLAGPMTLPVIDARTLASALATVADRRPDLMALKAGYESQQQQVREAILRQFPQLSIGPTQATDTSHVGMVGVGVSIGLPLFDHNQARIAQQRATRALLRQQYQARLDQAESQAHQVFDKISILSQRLAELESHLDELRQTATAAQTSFDQGNLGAGSYITLRSSALDQRIAALQLRATLAQSEIALDTLLGRVSDLPVKGHAT